jgi:inhibitor of the pro-sigma K processing machinery
MGSLNMPTMIAYGVAVVLLLFIVSAFKTPARIIAKLLLNGVLGLLALIMVNSIGNLINFHIPVNVYTIFITGILGIPGIVLTIILTRIF